MTATAMPLMNANAPISTILSECENAAGQALARLENVLQRIDPTPEVNELKGAPITGGLRVKAFDLRGAIARIDRLSEMLSEAI